MRDERKADLEKHVEAVNAMVKGDVYGSDRKDDDWEVREEGTGEWDGISEVPDVDREEKYIDEDKFTVVTVEAVEVGKEGLHKVRDKDEGDGDDVEPQGDEGSDRRMAKTSWANQRPAGGVKKKKKKFRYESKAERKSTRRKERTGSKAKAKMRRE